MKSPTLIGQIKASLAVVSLLFAAAGLASAQNGIWTNLNNGNASGSWAAAFNWNNGIIAGGAGNTADFSTLDITSGSTVTLDGPQTIGNLLIADVVPNTNWTFNAGTPSTSALTLAASSGSPVINVGNQTATFGASVFGAGGFTKTGGGTLRLNAVNTNGTGSLSGLIIVNNGILQAGNNSCFGVNGSVVNGSSTNAVICTNGGTVEIISTVQPNNELLLLAGTGNGGTNGALYANQPANAGSTRWGLSSLNASGASGNSSVSAPGILMVADTTIRIDGAAVGAYSNLLNCGYISSSTNGVANITNSFFTLTKTGTGRLNFERGIMVSNVLVQAGSVLPDSANGFNAVQQWTVRSGAALLNNQQNTFNATTIRLQIDAGGLYDVNWRGTGTPGSDNNAYTQNLGTLTGAGMITCGERGEIATQTLNIYGTNNSSFSGIITDTNGDVLNFGKTGGPAATLTLSGNNSYHGTTTVSSGTLLVDGSHTGGSNYVVSAGATLGGSGTIIPNAPNVINLAGTLLAGDNGGTLTISNVTGAGSVIVSNASLTVLGQLGTPGSPVTSMYLNNSTNTITLQGSAAISTATLNVDGLNNTLKVLIANPAVGQYPLIGNVSTIGGLNGFAGLNVLLPDGVDGYLSNNLANASIDLVITSTSTLVWSGTPNGNWDIGSTANWLNGGVASTYTETAGVGPFVNFDDTAAGTTTVNLTTTVTPKGITVSSSSKNYTFSGSGLVNGSGNWLKTGSSTLTLANTTPNTMNGTITIDAGAVSVGDGGAAGDLGAASVINSSSLIFNRSDNVTVGNSISGNGSLVNQGAGSTTLTGVGNVGGAVAINAGTLALAPAGTITVSGNVTGAGAFGVNAGTVVLSSPNVTYSGGTLINGGTLELDAAFPPSGSISDNGTLALGTSGTLANNISGTGGVSLLNNANVTLGGVNTYAGPTVVLGGAVTATSSSYSPNSVLDLGDQSGNTGLIGTANFSAGNPVLAGLNVGGNTTSPNAVNLTASGQTLTINGNMSVGAVAPVGASVLLQPTGSGVTLVVNTNGGTIQIGLGATGSGVNPDNVFVDLSGIDNFVANLGTNGAMNLGTLDGNPGPPAGATVVNWFNLAAVSNSITAGAINIGAGGRQLVPELRLGYGTNVFNVNTLAIGPGQLTSGRDGGYLYFLGGSGGLRLRAFDGISPAVFSLGNNPATTTGASITNTVDFTGHPVDLLISTLIIGNYNNVGVYQNTLSFDTGVLNAQSTSLSLIRNNNGANALASGSTLNIGGGTASLGPVSLTASAAYGTLNVAGAALSTANITSPGTGASTLSIANSTWSLAITNNGNPVTAPVVAQSFSASGTVNLSVNGTGWTVGQFPLISYTGSIGGDGYPALNLASLPAGVLGYLSNNLANLSVDLVITNAPVYVNTNPTNIVAVVNGRNLELSWPADHMGWSVQAQTNTLATGLGTNWVTIPGTDANNHYTNTIDVKQPTVFYRLAYP